MAVACAAADLLRRKALDVDLVMVLEGEEEAGSGGFVETVRRKKVQFSLPTRNFVVLMLRTQDMIGQIDAILVR